MGQRPSLAKGVANSCQSRSRFLKSINRFDVESKPLNILNNTTNLGKQIERLIKQAANEVRWREQARWIAITSYHGLKAAVESENNTLDRLD